jgi:hypothetical protein
MPVRADRIGATVSQEFADSTRYGAGREFGERPFNNAENLALPRVAGCLSAMEAIMSAKQVLAIALVLLSFAVFPLAQPFGAEPDEAGRKGQSVSLTTEKPQEAEAKTELRDPHFGYVGDIGTIVACAKAPAGMEAHAAFVVHHYPNQEKIDLGCTRLHYEGAKHLGNVDGWVFKTEWDGKAYPSKIFVSAQKVYFGGGRQAYVMADYRTETGWAWKLVPLRRLELVTRESAASRDE